jgi:hypothetical protein
LHALPDAHERKPDALATAAATSAMASAVAPSSSSGHAVGKERQRGAGMAGVPDLGGSHGRRWRSKSSAVGLSPCYQRQNHRREEHHRRGEAAAQRSSWGNAN